MSAGRRRGRARPRSPHNSPPYKRGRPPSGAPAATSIRVRSACGCHDVRGLGTLGTLDDLELDTLAFGQGLEAFHRDRGEVDEDVVATLALDEAVALLVRKPLDGALLHVRPPTTEGAGPRRRRRQWSTTRRTVASRNGALQLRGAGAVRRGACSGAASRWSWDQPRREPAS